MKEVLRDFCPLSGKMAATLAKPIWMKKDILTNCQYMDLIRRKSALVWERETTNQVTLSLNWVHILCLTIAPLQGKSSAHRLLLSSNGTWKGDGTGKTMLKKAGPDKRGWWVCSFILILEESSSKLKGGVEEVELLGCSIVCICICICICMSMISTCSTREKKRTRSFQNLVKSSV